MIEPQSKQEILDLVDSAWAALIAVVERVPPAALAEPDVEGAWSVKDLLAHITAWEKLMTRWLDEHARGATPQRPEPNLTWDDIDPLNARIYRENKDRPAAEILAEFHAFHRTARAAVAPIPEADLLEAARYPWMDGGPLWYAVAGNTWTHYDDHRQAIERWLTARR